MDEEQKKRIEEIMAGMECVRGFDHCKDGFENLCKAKDRGLEGYVDCMEDSETQCDFKLFFGDSVLCRCPVRVYIAKELKK
jgi:hypothetical protein